MIPNSMNEQKIREYAYTIWQREGCPHGRDLDHWLAAERQIMTARPEIATAPDGKPHAALVKGRSPQVAPTSPKAPAAAKRSTSRTRARKAPPTNPRKKT